MRWDIEETKAAIGYQPQDGSRATVLLSIWLKSRLNEVVFKRSAEVLRSLDGRLV